MQITLKSTKKEKETHDLIWFLSPLYLLQFVLKIKAHILIISALSQNDWITYIHNKAWILELRNHPE